MHIIAKKCREPSRTKRKIPRIDFKDPCALVPRISLLLLLSSDCIYMRYGWQKEEEEEEEEGEAEKKVQLEVASFFVTGGLFRIPAPP